MRWSKKRWVRTLGILLILLVIAAGAWYYFAKVRVPAFPINPADRPITWTFAGAYTGNADLEAKARADMQNLRGLLGKPHDDYDDYDLYAGIGNDDVLLGDGRSAYGAYNRAVHIHPDKGLAYLNLGNLFSLMGAYNTAADAYAAAVHAEPGVMQYHVQRLTFLTTYLPNDTAAIQAALKDASDQFGDAAPILSVEAQWLEKQGKYAEAITAWQTAEKLSPASSAPAIEAQIARDRAKE